MSKPINLYADRNIWIYIAGKKVFEMTGAELTAAIMEYRERQGEKKASEEKEKCLDLQDKK